MDRLLDDFDPTDIASASFFDIQEIARKLGVVLSNSTELKGVELAWSSVQHIRFTKHVVQQLLLCMLLRDLVLLNQFFTVFFPGLIIGL